MGFSDLNAHLEYGNVFLLCVCVCESASERDWRSHSSKDKTAASKERGASMGRKMEKKH